MHVELPTRSPCKTLHHLAWAKVTTSLDIAWARVAHQTVNDDIGSCVHGTDDDVRQ